MGFSVKQLFILEEKEWQHQSFLIQWIIVDSFIMLLQRYYIYASQMMMMSGELMKNIYTLQFAQGKALEERKRRRQLEIKESMDHRISEFFKGKNIQLSQLMTKASAKKQVDDSQDPMLTSDEKDLGEGKIDFGRISVAN